MGSKSRPKWLRGKMIIMDHLVEGDMLIPEDQRTMMELREMKISPVS